MGTEAEMRGQPAMKKKRRGDGVVGGDDGVEIGEDCAGTGGDNEDEKERQMMEEEERDAEEEEKGGSNDDGDREEGDGEERHEFVRSTSTWMLACPNDVDAELGGEIVDDAERRMRVLAWIVKAGVSPGLTIDEDSGLTLLRFVRGWVRSRMREVSLLDELRDEHVAVFGWTELWKEDVDFLEGILQGERVVEVGAGSGWVSWLLSLRGIDVSAYDVGGGVDGRGGDTFVEEWKLWPWFRIVQKGSVSSLLVNNVDSQSCLLLCWPDLDTHLATDALNAFRGNMFVYIGESGEDSCTAEMSFFQSLSENWMLRAHRDTAHAPGCNDGIFFYERLTPLPLARA